MSQHFEAIFYDTAARPTSFAKIRGDLFSRYFTGTDSYPVNTPLSFFEPTTRVRRTIAELDACDTGITFTKARLYEA
jgi:hypothetical protein